MLGLRQRSLSIGRSEPLRQPKFSKLQLVRKSVRDSVERRLGSEFEKDLFRAAVDNLSDEDNPLRFNNFAYACRELVRHVLERLAPDDSVRKCTWYKTEGHSKESVTRRQRVYYAVQGGLSDSYLRTTLGLTIDEMHRELRDAVDRLSKYTHINENTFNVGATLGRQYAEETLTAVIGLFEEIDGCRKALVEKLWEHIDSSVIQAALNETIDAIDVLATHHFIDEIYTADVTITGIDNDCIYFLAEGSIACDLQWGSNSDLDRGDGMIRSESFSFECDLYSPVENPSEVVADEGSLKVDTTSWRDNY